MVVDQNVGRDQQSNKQYSIVLYPSTRSTGSSSGQNIGFRLKESSISVRARNIWNFDHVNYLLSSEQLNAEDRKESND